MQRRDSINQDPEFEALIRYIQERRGMDFRGYKRTSLRRRISLRMEEAGIDRISTYQAFLEAHPQEFGELLNTVLINVTSFFRDQEAWDILKTEVIPAMLSRGDEIRVWSVGCATGEEPYSVAMLLAEKLGTAEFCRRVKVYATDLDEAALRAARHATYTARDVESVPPELLEKYFERTDHHYIFQRELRKSVIFGRHNVVLDAPISRIDLLLCRNLLIHLEAETQNTVLPRLHYALVNDGFLFLGKAETQLGRSKMFRPVDVKHRLFAKVSQEWRRTAGGGLSIGTDVRKDGTTLQTRILEAIVDDSPTAYIVVDNEGRVVFVNMAARRVLDIGEGDLGRPFQDLSVSYRPTELRSRIDEAQREGRPVRIEHQEFFRPMGEGMRMTIEVTPLLGRDNKPFATLLSFAETTRIYTMQQELEAAQESLETTIEELQSANEELETTNEELQSTNEELETTNEELQSTNEELETMNEELRSTNEELESANEEMRLQAEKTAEYRAYADSVLRSIDAGIIVLNQNGTVRSWNRWSENAWGLRAEEVLEQPLLDLDIGLPVHLLSKDLDGVAKGERTNAEQVLQAGDRRGRGMMCRVRMAPLIGEMRTSEGAVVIIEDVTSEHQTEDYVRHLGRVIGKSLNEVYFLDPETLRFTVVNAGAEHKLGFDIARLRQLSLAEIMPDLPLQRLRELIKPLINGEKQEIVFETMLRARGGRTYPAEICMQYMAEESPPILVAIVHDTTERQKVS